MVSALHALEAKIRALKSGDEVHMANAALQGQVHTLESQVANLRQAGEEAVHDLDLALHQLADLTGGARG